MGATVIVKENECSTKNKKEDHDVSGKNEYYLKFYQNQKKWINVVMEKKKKFSFKNTYNTFIKFYTDRKQMVYEKYNLNRYITFFSNILLLFFMMLELFVSSCKTVLQLIKNNTKEILFYSFNKFILTSQSILNMSLIPSLHQYYKSLVDKVSSILKRKTESLLLIKKKIVLQYNDVRVFIQEAIESITVYILSKCEFYKSKMFFNPFGKL